MPPTTPTQLWYRYETARGRKRKKGDAPDEKLSKCGGALDEGETDRLNIKLEEDPRDTRMGAELPFVVRDTVLICM